MVRVAAMADVHFGTDSAGTLRPHLEHIPERADVLLIAGDLTRCGKAEEAQVIAEELTGLPVRTFAVLGNHDHEADQADGLKEALEGAGVRVLMDENAVIDVDGVRVGITGAKGFGGGFAGACGSDFGEPEMKSFIRHTKQIAERIGSLLADLDTDVRIVILHYSPVEETLRGERLEIFPFLGSYLLAEAIDHAGADLIVHGHAHNGNEKGMTPGGIPVRNVAQTVLRQAYVVYEVGEEPFAAAAAGVFGQRERG